MYFRKGPFFGPQPCMRTNYIDIWAYENAMELDNLPYVGTQILPFFSLLSFSCWVIPCETVKNRYSGLKSCRKSNGLTKTCNPHCGSPRMSGESPIPDSFFVFYTGPLKRVADTWYISWGTLMLTLLPNLDEGNPAELPVVVIFIMLFTFCHSPGAGCVPFLYLAEVWLVGT